LLFLELLPYQQTWEISSEQTSLKANGKKAYIFFIMHVMFACSNPGCTDHIIDALQVLVLGPKLYQEASG